MNVLAIVVSKLGRGVGFVGGFIFREPRVAVDSEKRPARRPGIGNEMGADFFKVRAEIGDESLEGFPYFVDVSGLVCVEPFAVVVGFQVFEEFEKLIVEMRFFCCHANSPVAFIYGRQECLPHQKHSDLKIFLSASQLRVS